MKILQLMVTAVVSLRHLLPTCVTKQMADAPTGVSYYRTTYTKCKSLHFAMPTLQ